MHVHVHFQTYPFLFWVRKGDSRKICVGQRLLGDYLQLIGQVKDLESAPNPLLTDAMHGCVYNIVLEQEFSQPRKLNI